MRAAKWLANAVLMCRHLSGSWTAAYLKPKSAQFSVKSLPCDEHETKGKVSLNTEIEPFDENRVKIKHKLSYVRPTNRGKISEEDTTETPMYVNRGGRLTILQEDRGDSY